MYCGEGMKPLHETHASARGAFDNIFMNGQEVFKFAVRAVPTVFYYLSSYIQLLFQPSAPAFQHLTVCQAVLLSCCLFLTQSVLCHWVYCS